MKEEQKKDNDGLRWIKVDNDGQHWPKVQSATAPSEICELFVFILRRIICILCFAYLYIMVSNNSYWPLPLSPCLPVHATTIRGSIFWKYQPTLDNHVLQYLVTHLYDLCYLFIFRCLWWSSRHILPSCCKRKWNTFCQGALSCWHIYWQGCFLWDSQLLVSSPNSANFSFPPLKSLKSLKSEQGRSGSWLGLIYVRLFCRSKGFLYQMKQVQFSNLFGKGVGEKICLSRFLQISHL